MRIVTRPDFDGIVCAVLLREVFSADTDIYWTEPGDIQSKSACIQKGDILANLPFSPSCDLWFDHHVSNRPAVPFKGAFDIAPSAARVIYTHYIQKGLLDHRFDELLDQTDIIDAARLTRDQVRFPQNYPYILLSMTIQNKNYADTAYWNWLVEQLRVHPIEKILDDRDVQHRCATVIQDNAEFESHLMAHTRVHNAISVTDFRSLDPVPDGNRFLVYCLFPQVIASVKIRYKSPKKDQVLLSIGHSIFNRQCQVNIGTLLSKFGGGGHAGAGGCTLDARDADARIQEILDILFQNQRNFSA